MPKPVSQYPGNNRNCSSPSSSSIKYMSGCYVKYIFITRTSDRLEVFPFFPFFPLSALRPLCVAWPTYAKISMSRQNRVYYKRSVTWQMPAGLPACLSVFLHLHLNEGIAGCPSQQSNKFNKPPALKIRLSSRIAQHADATGRTSPTLSFETVTFQPPIIPAARPAVLRHITDY